LSWLNDTSNYKFKLTVLKKVLLGTFSGFRAIVPSPQDSVTSGTQKATDNTSGMVVVNSKFVFSRSLAADSADPLLVNHQGVIFGARNSILPFKMRLPAPSFSLFCSRVLQAPKTQPFSIAFSILSLALFDYRQVIILPLFLLGLFSSSPCFPFIWVCFTQFSVVGVSSFPVAVVPSFAFGSGFWGAMLCIAALSTMGTQAVFFGGVLVETRKRFGLLTTSAGFVYDGFRHAVHISLTSAVNSVARLVQGLTTLGGPFCILA
jgi:hypothetical protein